MLRCPICQAPLKMRERQGIEIDYCPKCRGAWLDSGELGHIVERSQDDQTRKIDRTTTLRRDWQRWGDEPGRLDGGYPIRD